MTLRQVLIAARALIPTSRYWQKGGFGDGRYSLTEALEAVATVNGVLNRKLYARARRALHPYLTWWQDHPDTTHRDVLELLDAAIGEAA